MPPVILDGVIPAVMIGVTAGVCFNNFKYPAFADAGAFTGGIPDSHFGCDTFNDAGHDCIYDLSDSFDGLCLFGLFELGLIDELDRSQ